MSTLQNQFTSAPHSPRARRPAASSSPRLLAATTRMESLANDLIAARCFDIPAIVLLLHERVNVERRLQAVIARLRIPPLAKPNFGTTSTHT